MPLPSKTPTRKKQIKLSAITAAKVMKLLLDGDVTSYQIAEETGLGYITTLRYINALKKEGVIRIDGWVRSGNQHVATYKIGQTPDAVKKRKPPSESSAEYRARKKMKAMIQMTAGQFRQAA